MLDCTRKNLGHARTPHAALRNTTAHAFCNLEYWLSPWLVAIRSLYSAPSKVYKIVIVPRAAWISGNTLDCYHNFLGSASEVMITVSGIPDITCRRYYNYYLIQEEVLKYKRFPNQERDPKVSIILLFYFIISSLEIPEDEQHCQQCGRKYKEKDSHLWVGCEMEGCWRWWHYTCVNLPRLPVEDETWICPVCQHW